MQTGDVVTRMVSGSVPQQLRITELTLDRIYCGVYEFDRSTGAEIDDCLDWGPPPMRTGSFPMEVVRSKA